jgi:hypothetical protein
MSSLSTATEVLDREFLEIRAKVLALAAAFDRLDRAAGDGQEDPRLVQLRQAVDLLREPRSDRAEQVQLLFSRAYQPDWRTQFGI